jgi:hypothetical protein
MRMERRDAIQIFKKMEELGEVAHIFNSSYSEGRDQRIMVSGQAGQKVSENLSQ